MRRNEGPGGLPDEDVLTIPKAWHEQVHPRRGGVPGPALEPELLAAAPPTDAADPAEAARKAPGHMGVLHKLIDTWVLRHGVAYAAAAMLELERSAIAPRTYGPRQAAYLRMRRHLAAAGDADYAEAVRSMALRRVDFGTRLLSGYLAPTEAAWVDEACDEYRTAVRTNWDSWLLVCSLSTPRQFASVGPEELVTATLSRAEVLTLAEGLGAAALPAFEDALDSGRYLDNDLRRDCYEVLALLPTDEAFEALAKRLDRRYVYGEVVRAMKRFPVRTFRVLAKTANGPSGGAPAARKLLATHIRTHADLVDAVLAAAPEHDAELISELAFQTAGKPEATASELPPLLVAPPWTQKRVKPAARTVVAGLEPPHVRRLEWAEGEREAWAASDVFGARVSTDWEEQAAKYAESRVGNSWPVWRFFAHAPEHLARPLLSKWKPELSYGPGYDALACIVARFGQDATDLAVDAALQTSPTARTRFPAPVLDLAVARMMAHWLDRLDSGRAQAASWLSRHAETAALLLVPDAVGEPGDRRVPAEAALRFLAPLTDVGAAARHYGPRRFRVGFDEQLAPVVADEAGVRRKSLPAPDSKDDAELAAAARKQFSGLKRDVRTVAGDTIRRLESAMATGRGWQADEFRGLLLDHPLVRHITRRLVWLGGATREADPSGGTVTAFRVAEDRTLATVADEPYLLPQDAVVRIAHPLHLGDELGAWAELFADYEILQPFEQLGRDVYAPTEQERGEGRLTRFEGAGNVPLGKILGLVAQGWERATPMNAGVESNISRKLEENLYIVLDLKPGIAVGIPHELGPQTLSGVYLSKRPTDLPRAPHDGGVPLGTLDPIAASELLRDLTRLTN